MPRDLLQYVYSIIIKNFHPGDYLNFKIFSAFLSETKEPFR